MVKTNELRLGNYLLDEENITRIVSLIGYNVIYSKSKESPTFEEEAKGVPLTEEILLKCGAVLENDLGDSKDYILPNCSNKYGVCFDHEDISLKYYTNNGYYCLIYDHPRFQYLHQLQNFYHSIMGEELTIKL